MRSSRVLFSLVVVAGVANVTLAQPEDTYVSGLLHQPLGGITDFTVDGRRLSACCLGSSGEDGVEVRFDSAYGGAVAVEVGDFLSTAGATLRHRSKGWDGLVYGSHELVSYGDGTGTFSFDFSGLGATALHVVEYAEDGTVLSDEIVPGPSADRPWVPNFTCPGGGTPILVWGWRRVCPTCPWFHWIGWVCVVPGGGTTGTYTFERVRIEVTPTLPGGVPDPEGVESLMVTGSGISELHLSQAHLATDDVQSWGVGQAHLSEECIGFPPPCAGSERGLVASNIGSSGEDGVSIDLGPGATSAQILQHTCCRGHVIIMKAYDDEGQEQARFAETSNPAPTLGTVSPDFSARGSSEFDVAYVDSNGAVLAVAVCSNGTALEVPNPDGTCPSDTRESWWIEGGGSDVIEKRFCAPSGLLALPGGGGVSGVSSMRFKAANPTLGHQPVRTVVATSPDPEPIVIDGVSVERPVYASGLPHLPLGEVTSLSVDGRRLSACCLGSSGEDGVEVLFRSAYGGAAAVEVADLLSTAGATLRHRSKGWDGLVYGNHQLVSHGDGTGTFTFDFSGLGATEVRVAEYAEDGTLLSDVITPGPSVDKEWVPSFTCPLGGTPILVTGWRRVCPTCPWFYWIGWACMTPGGGTSGTYTFERIVVTPTLPGGVPDPEGVESLSVAGSGIAELHLPQAQVSTFGVQGWGAGQAHVSEQCSDLGGCTPEQRELRAGNIGSSGEDGVSIDLGPDAGGLSAALARDRCCRGHVIIMKLYDDAGQEQRVSRTQIDELSPLEELDADFSSMGGTGFRLTLFDALGGVIGPPGGLDFIGGGPKPWMTGLCQPGQTEWWVNEGTSSNPVWVFHGCVGGYDFVLPGYGEVNGVASFQIEPLGLASSFGRPIRCDITGTDPEGLVIRDIGVAVAARGDVNLDGQVDLADFAVLANCLAGPNTGPPLSGCDVGQFSHADLDGDADVDLADVAAFQKAYAE